MNKQQHTPGPWTTSQGQHALTVHHENTDEQKFNARCSIAHCFGPDQEANARLIAAAPELLELVERLAPVDCVAASGGSDGCDHCIAVELIARATGDA